MDDCKFSDSIGNFLEFLEYAKISYINSCEEMQRQDKITQDYLHSLELDGLSYSERGKTATKIVTNRKTRREHKDKVELFHPLITFLNDTKNQNFINQLRSVYNQMQKVEKQHTNRTYTPRIIKPQNPKN